MNREEGPRAPPSSGFRRSHNKNGKKTNKEEGLPPPRPLEFRRSHTKNNKKVNKEEGPPPPPPPPPPPSPFPRILGFRRFSPHTDMSLICPIKRPLCLLSHPNHPHTLLRRSGELTGRSSCFSCGRGESWNIDQFYFYCTTCKVDFHSGCHKFPRKVTHPYHLHHPLTFTFRNETGLISDGNIDESFWNMVLSEANTSGSNTSDPDPKKFGSVQASRAQSNTVFDKCTWCRGIIQGNWFYRCSICNFCFDLSCFQNILLLIIPNPKSHHHSLVFYPRPLLTPCDACGLVNVLDPSYACFQCDYMVHRSCIDLPRVIKITRHQHRLFHSPYLHPIASPCRVCYKALDVKYGLYSCNHGDCSYVGHSKCATDKHVWDGEEIEWEPEEPNEPEDIAPFKKFGSDKIRHFSHKHLLKLKKYDGVRDAEKQCRACVLPLNSHDFYNCTKCDFSLHEACAGLVRKLDHALHVHPLVLELPSRKLEPLSGCSVCSRTFTGFKYKCSKEDCAVLNKFQVDVCCVLVQDYFTHKIHEHPLFISTSYKGENKVFCKGCEEICMESYLQCTVCKFAMCYQCVTIPTELYYKHDKHPLSLCYGEKGVDGMYWCEVCEKEVNPMDWFYTCNECCVTIHLQCVFGSSAYMKRGFTLYHHSTKMEVIHNSKSTRPFCITCGQRCPSSLYFRFSWLGKTFCSLDCFVANEKMMVLTP